MIFVLLIPLAIFGLICGWVLVAITARYRAATNTRKFTRTWLLASAAFTLATIFATALMYLGQRVYVVTIFFFVALGPPVWILSAAYFFLRQASKSKASEATSYYAPSEATRKKAALEASDLLSAIGSGALFAIPANVVLFLLNLSWIASLVGLHVDMH